MSTIKSHSVHMDNLKKRIAELYAEGQSHTQVRLAIRKEFILTRLLAPSAVQKAQMVHRCGGSEENFSRVKKWRKNLELQNQQLRGGKQNANMGIRNENSEENTEEKVLAECQEASSETGGGECATRSETTSAGSCDSQG